MLQKIKMKTTIEIHWDSCQLYSLDLGLEIYSSVIFSSMMISEVWGMGFSEELVGKNWLKLT